MKDTGKILTIGIIESELGISIRSQSEQPQELERYSPRQIQKWLSGLPRANIGQTAKQLYSRLCESNKIILPANVRLAFLKALQPETERLQENLEKHFIKAGISLKSKQKKVAELTRAILNEEAYAHKSVLQQIISSDNLHKQKKETGEALFFTAYYLARLIGHCYQLYLSPPAKLWRELHIIFQLAQQHGLDRMEVVLPKPKVKTTLRTIYKSTLLLSLGHPNELRSTDFWLIQFEHLEFAKKIRLTTNINDEIEYVVNMNSKAAPFHRSLVATDIDSYYLGIDVHPLMFYLQNLISSKEPSSQHHQPVLIRHLLSALGNMATRSFSRTHCNEGIQVAIGLASTHALIEKGLNEIAELELEQQLGSIPVPLNGEDALTKLEGSLKNVEVLGVEDSMRTHPSSVQSSDLKKEDDDKWIRMYRPKVSVNESKELQKRYHLVPVNMSTKSLPREYRLLPAAILNISPGGYCLKLEGDLPKQTQTDEIIGLMEIDDEGGCSWNIGIIRWLHRSADNGLSAGIQLISPNAKSVNTTLRSNKNQAFATHRSLLLPSLTHIGQPASLITPTMPYQVGSVVSMTIENQQLELKLQELLQAGRSYSRFTFVELNPQQKSSLKDEQLQVKEDDFSTVWKIL